MSIPGIGPIISSAMVAAIGTGDSFSKGRDFAAWLGLVPRQISTGDRTILGKISKRGGDLRAQKLPGRLHVRAMVRDGDTAFVGSQSLRALELDGRREVGLITREARVVKRILEVFESDWARTDLGQKELKVAAKIDKEPEQAAVAS